MFEVKKRAARKARNPRTGEKVFVAEKYVVTFKPGKEMEERVKQLELEGYLVLPDLVPSDQLAHLKLETAQLPTRAVDYSPHQRGCPGVEFHGGAITELIANPPAVEFLEKVFGLAQPDVQPGHTGRHPRACLHARLERIERHAAGVDGRRLRNSRGRAGSPCAWR